MLAPCASMPSASRAPSRAPIRQSRRHSRPARRDHQRQRRQQESGGDQLRPDVEPVGDRDVAGERRDHRQPDSQPPQPGGDEESPEADDPELLDDDAEDLVVERLGVGDGDRLLREHVTDLQRRPVAHQPVRWVDRRSPVVAFGREPFGEIAGDVVVGRQHAGVSARSADIPIAFSVAAVEESEVDDEDRRRGSRAAAVSAAGAGARGRGSRGRRRGPRPGSSRAAARSSRPARASGRRSRPRKRGRRRRPKRPARSRTEPARRGPRAASPPARRRLPAARSGPGGAPSIQRISPFVLMTSFRASLAAR